MSRRNQLFDGFNEGTSVNIPQVDAAMVIQYIINNANLYQAEYRHKKTLDLNRTTYHEDAIGYVQVNEQNGIITVKAQVTAQHRDRIAYPVTTVINNDEEEILSSRCTGCAASIGGCKHSMALVFWLLKKTNEPATTEVECYWRPAAFTHANLAQCKFEFLTYE